MSDTEVNLVKRSAVSILCSVFWGVLLYLGITLYVGVVRQEIAGYPDTAQLRFYILFPIAMTLLSACLAIFVKKLPKSLFIILSFSQLALIPPYLLFYTGGI